MTVRSSRHDQFGSEATVTRQLRTKFYESHAYFTTASKIWRSVAASS